MKADKGTVGGCLRGRGVGEGMYWVEAARAVVIAAPSWHGRICPAKDRPDRLEVMLGWGSRRKRRKSEPNVKQATVS